MTTKTLKERGIKESSPQSTLYFTTFQQLKCLLEKLSKENQAAKEQNSEDLLQSEKFLPFIQNLFRVADSNEGILLGAKESKNLENVQEMFLEISAERNSFVTHMKEITDQFETRSQRELYEDQGTTMNVHDIFVDFMNSESEKVNNRLEELGAIEKRKNLEEDKQEIHKIENGTFIYIYIFLGEGILTKFKHLIVRRKINIQQIWKSCDLQKNELFDFITF